MSAIDIRHLGPGDDAIVDAAGNLFDKAPIPAATAAFLAASDHHLFIAFIDGEPAGFVSGVETIHADKGTEMFLYELGVDEAFRGRGVGTGLVQALADLARERGCYVGPDRSRQRGRDRHVPARRCGQWLGPAHARVALRGRIAVA